MEPPRVKNVCFSNMYESLCGWMDSSGIVQITSEAFAEMPCDTTRVAFALNQPEVHTHIAPMTEKSEKDANLSEQLQEQSNNVFKAKQYNVSIKGYTKSIQLAPSCKEDDSNSLSLAFANRSAALFHVKRFSECIVDVDNALEHDYPKNLRYKLYERKGRCYASLDKFNLAQKIFTQAMACLDEMKMDKKKKKAMEKIFDECLDGCRKRRLAPKPEKFEIVHNCDQPDFDTPLNAIFPSLSASVDVAYSKDKGRYIVAKEYIPPGKIVMIEKPFASVLLVSQLFSHCHHCLKRTMTSLPCVSCVYVGFCSKKCRAQAMETYHKVECQYHGTLKNSGLDKFSHLAIRTVSKQPLKELLAYRDHLQTSGYKYDSDDTLKGCTDEKKYVADNYHAIHTLVTHSSDRKGHDLYRRTITAIYLLKLLQIGGYFSTKKGGKDKLATTDNLSFIGGLLLSHLQLLPCNAHEVSELELDPLDVPHSTTLEVGAAIYATLSLFNHACNPAVTRHFHAGGTCAVRTVRAVHPGEDVTDNYGAVSEMHARDVRRADLLAPQYYFQCACEACTDDWPQFEVLHGLPTRWRCRRCLAPAEDHGEAAAKCDAKFGREETDALEKLLLESDEKFRAGFAHLLQCEWQKALPLLLEPLEVLDNVVPPHKAFSSCQEAIKQCYNFMGNCYITRLPADVN